MMKVFVFIACLGLVSCGQTCKSYKSYIQPLIEGGNITELQKVFKAMNHKNQAVHIYRSAPIADTIWPEMTSIKMLISLSKPLVPQIEAPNMWPENNNIRISTMGAAGVFNPASTYHGGMRYVYNCATLQEKTCFGNECIHDPEYPILVGKHNEQIFVPLENFIAANGDAMSDHITVLQNEVKFKSTRKFKISGFSKLSVRECGARQVFFNGTSPTDCFELLKFFSLPEALESRTAPEDDAPYTQNKRKRATPQIRILVKRSHFVVMS